MNDSAISTKTRGGGVDVLAKRTYLIGPRKKAAPAPHQYGICELPDYGGEEAEAGDGPPLWDSDRLCSAKPGTDLVVRATAHAPDRPVAQLEVAVGVATASGGFAFAERTRRRLLVIGPRRVAMRSGRIEFTKPEDFTSMPLGWDRSYGGRDEWAERMHPDPAADFLVKYSNPRVARRDVSSFTYPRNGSGCGYLVHRSDQALAELRLPNIERIDDRLTPERLILGGVDRWHTAPLPGGFDWYCQSWFPRSAFTGISPRFAGEPQELPEVKSGLLPQNLARVDAARWISFVLGREAATAMPIDGEQLLRFGHGASPWLALPTLTGAESVVLWGMHPTERVWTIELPRTRARMRVSGLEGHIREIEPALRTIFIDTEKAEMVLVWAGRLVLEGRNAAKQRVDGDVEFDD